MNHLEYEDIFGISEAEGHAQADRANRLALSLALLILAGLVAL